MSTIARYCENCGKPLNARARFCGRCGKAVPQTSEPPQNYSQKSTPTSQTIPPQPVASPSSNEIIVTALPVGTQRTGFLGMRAQGFVLVLTNLRVIVAQQTPELMKANAAQAKASAKQGGKGLLGQWGAVIGSYGSQRYLEMHPQKILDETPGNYFILNHQVQKVQIKEYYDDESGRNETKLIMNTVGNKIELTFTHSKGVIKKALQQTLGNIVR